MKRRRQRWTATQRRAALSWLNIHGEALSLADVAGLVEIPEAVARALLKRLGTDGLVSTERDGRRAMYRIARDEAA